MFRKLLPVLVFTLLFAAFAPVLAQDSGTAGEIDVLLRWYYRPEQFPDAAAIVESIAAEYMEMNPDATINLVPDFPETGSPAWIAARMAAGDAPDITFDHWFRRNLQGGNWWVSLNEFLEMPNPYIAEGLPGHERWLDSLYDVGMSISRAPDGHHYQVSLDWVESAMFYNVAMFEEAGVEADWTSWSGFIADMHHIQDTLGVDALGTFFAGSGWSNWYWADSVFLSAVWADMAAELQMDKFYDPEATLEFPGWRILNTEEIARAIIDGTLDATDARMDNFLRISREFSEILPIDYIGGMTSLDDLMRLWLSEELAVVWAGTWTTPSLLDNAFEWKIMYLPPFSEDDFAGAPGTTYSTGGPSAAAQYGVPNSTAEAGNLELAVDWLMWMSAPQNFGPVANETAGFLTTVAGTEASPVLQDFEAILALPDRLFTDPNGRLTAVHGDEWSQIMQGYLLGETDEAATRQLLQDSWMKGALAVCENNGFEWCP